MNEEDPMEQPSHLYVIMNGTVRFTLWECDRTDVHDLYRRIVEKYGESACRPPVGACFQVFLTDEQMREFAPAGRPFGCPVCEWESRTQPRVIREDNATVVYECPRCKAVCTSYGDTVSVAWDERAEHSRRWAKGDQREPLEV